MTQEEEAKKPAPDKQSSQEQPASPQGEPAAPQGQPAPPQGEPAGTNTEGKTESDPHLILNELEKDAAAKSSEGGPKENSIQEGSSPVGSSKTADEMISEVMTRLDGILVKVKEKKNH